MRLVYFVGLTVARYWRRLFLAAAFLMVVGIVFLPAVRYCPDCGWTCIVFGWC